MKLHQLRLDIEKRHTAGETYQEIADSYGITKPMAFQIAVNGYKPGKRTAAILGLEPESGLVATRRRRALLDEVARVKGFASWCAYETQVLEDYKERERRETRHLQEV